MQACMPALQQGPRALRGWREVLIYPGEFKVQRSHHDERSGVVSEGDDMLIGEAWEHGPLVLSLADVQLDLEHPWDGYNVVVHEMAHKLDMLDGPPDGVPPLPAHIVRRHWIVAFQRAFDHLANDVARGRETLIDAYAAESARRILRRRQRAALVATGRAAPCRCGGRRFAGCVLRTARRHLVRWRELGVGSGGACSCVPASDQHLANSVHRRRLAGGLRWMVWAPPLPIPNPHPTP